MKKLLILTGFLFIFLFWGASRSEAGCSGTTPKCSSTEHTVCRINGVITTCDEDVDPGCSCNPECTGTVWTCNACSSNSSSSTCSVGNSCLGVGGCVCMPHPSGGSCTWSSSTQGSYQSSYQSSYQGGYQSGYQSGYQGGYQSNYAPTTVLTNVGIYLEDGDDITDRTDTPPAPADSTEPCIQGSVSIEGSGTYVVYGGTGGHCNTDSNTIDRPLGTRDISINLPNGYEVIGGFYRYLTPAGGWDPTDSRHPLMNTSDPTTVRSGARIGIRWGIAQIAHTKVGIYNESGVNPDDHTTNGTEPCIAGNFKLSSPADPIKTFPVTSGGGECGSLKDYTSTGGVLRKVQVVLPADKRIGGGWFTIGSNPTKRSLLDDSATQPHPDYVQTGYDLDIRFGLVDQTYGISGGIFLDADGNGVKANDGTEPYKANAGKIKIKGPITQTSNGTTITANPDPDASGFRELGFKKGKYTVTYTNMDPKYEATYPPGDSSSPPAYTAFTIGSKCEENLPIGIKNLACNANGGMTGVDFGVALVGAARNPWYQVTGGSITIGRGITNKIPDDTSACTTSTQHFMDASQVAPAAAIDPGVIVSGGGASLLPQNSVKTSSDQKASVNKWLLLNDGRHPVTSKTSYTTLTDLITKGGLAKPDIFAAGQPCNGNGTKPNCTFSGNSATAGGFQKGIYTAAGLTIKGSPAYTFDGNRNFIFLINGDLIIQRNLIVAPGSTVYFAVKGNITVTSGVTRIDGVYSAEKSFLAPPAVPAGTDSILTIQGNVIANAAGASDNVNTFLAASPNTRDLGASLTTGNSVCPAVRVIFRPDFILNLPDTIKIANKTVQEVNSSSSTSTGNYVTPIPTPTPPPPDFGLAAHLMWGPVSNTKQITLMKNAGVKWVRFDVGWKWLERTKKGDYLPGKDASSIAYLQKLDTLLSDLRTAGIKPVIDLIESPPWSNGNQSSFYPPTNPQDYADMYSFLADRYKAYDYVYEVWNEPNYVNFWKPTPDAVAYTNLLKKAYPAIKTADPQATVLGGSIVFGDATSTTFLDNMYANGAKPFFDALSIHPYGFSAPPSDTGQYGVKGIIDRMRARMVANNDSTKKIYITEIGWFERDASHPSWPDDALRATWLADLVNIVTPLDYVKLLAVYILSKGATPEDDTIGLYNQLNGNPTTPTLSWTSYINAIQ